MNQRFLFWVYCIFAILISYIPLVGLPFIYLGTIFHEISHALVALITGGNVLEFSLSPNGSGHVVSQGGSRFLIAFSGYLGVSIWAALLFKVGNKDSTARLTLAVLIALFSMTLILWVNTLITFIILAIVIGMLALMLLKIRMVLIPYIAQAMAILILFNAIKSPLYLIDGRNFGDGAALAKITWIPEIIWVSIWCAIGVGVLYMLYRSTANNKQPKG